MFTAFDIAIKVEALVKNLLNINKGFINQGSKVEEAAKMTLVEVEAKKKSHAEKSMKLCSSLSKIESLKKDVHLSQSEVASLTKRVETSDTY